MDNAVTVRSETEFDEKPSLAVVERVAELEGEDPAELTPRLYAAIDPQALDSLFRSTDSSTSGRAETVQFTYLGYDVCVQNDGETTVINTS